jgi:hypothetical protein
MENPGRTRLETKALVIGYAMSRLDDAYLAARKCSTWRDAFAEAATSLDEPPASFKNLRDEFDPMHPNPRMGWHRRALRPNRQRVLDELHDVSDDALTELVARILSQDEGSVVEAVDSLAVTTRVAHNVAERLLTGRRAEDFFLANSEALVNVPAAHILDMRNAARGFDFGVMGNEGWAIEVKGLKQLRGDVQFTDREWVEAKRRRENYWMVVVGGLAGAPTARVIRDPYLALTATSTMRTTVTAVWRARVSV